MLSILRDSETMFLFWVNLCIKKTWQYWRQSREKKFKEKS